MQGLDKDLAAAGGEIAAALREKIIPFWLARSVDAQWGGYLTSLDENGDWDGNGEKYIVTQSRMVWGFSHLWAYAGADDRPALEKAARQGVRFLLERFWDKEYGGFFWHVRRDGAVADPAKLVYGQGFAIYALSEFALRFHESEALEYAERTFALLQLYAADTLRGGYYENIERDWRISPGGVYAGDRKSLDIHMHLMEAFTTLCQASGKEIHRRKLREVTSLILRHMADCQKGYGYNQFDLDFRQLPAINIARTWNAEREAGETIAEPADTTSYGHNVELSWLLHLCCDALGEGLGTWEAVPRRLLDHALQYGYDYEFGGVYRDGIADKAVLVTDKEWWQNFEALVGFLNGYTRYHDQKYRQAFLQSWGFVRDKFINWQAGESRQLLDRRGGPIIASLGNPWKGIYHTGRALAECLDRLDILKRQGKGENT